jgi:hypothetical protein
MTPKKPLKLAITLALALAATALLFASQASAQIKSFSAVRAKSTTVYFNVKGVSAARVRTAYLSGAGRRHTVSVARLRRAIKRHRLFKVRVRRHARGVFASGTTSLVVTTAPTTCPNSSSSYKSMILGTATLRGYWRVDETTGTAACDATGAAHGNYGGGYAQGVGGALAGDPNPAVGLDGSTGHIRVPSSSGLSPIAGVSVEAWVKPNAVTTWQTVARKDGQ